MYYERGGRRLDTVTLPAWPGTRNRLGLRQHGLIPVHLEKCLFLLSLPFLRVAYSCAVVDKKDHTTGAIQHYNGKDRQSLINSVYAHYHEENPEQDNNGYVVFK